MQQNKNTQNDSSVFVWGHFGKKLEILDKERFILLAEKNPHTSLARLYNKNVNELMIELKKLIDENKNKEKKDIDTTKIKEILDKLANENKLDMIFREANKLMLGMGDSVSFGSLVTGQFESKVKHGKMVTHKEKVDIE